MTTSPLDSALSLRKDLIFVVSEVQSHSGNEPLRVQSLTTDLKLCLTDLEFDIGSRSVSSGASKSPDEAVKRRCEASLRAMFLRFTRSSDGLDEPSFLGLLKSFRVIPVLINEQEAQQAFRAKAKGKATVKQFLQIMSICSLAFARPPHNAKIGASEIHLWRFLGLTDGSWKNRLPA